MIKDWLSRAISRFINNLGRVGRFDGPINDWDLAASLCVGYQSEDILQKVLSSTLSVKKGDAVFERDSVLFYQIEYVWPLLSGLMWAASQNKGVLNVLDFGGALGSTYFQHRGVLDTLPVVRWSVVEQPNFVLAGKMYIQDETLRFYNSVMECLVENNPNVVVLSSVLQYLPDPTNTLLSLLKVDADFLIIDKTIVNHSDSNRIYIQHVPSSIYNASYPCWSLSEKNLLEVVTTFYLLIADFSSLDFPVLKSIDSEFKGYIFQRVNA